MLPVKNKNPQPSSRKKIVTAKSYGGLSSPKTKGNKQKTQAGKSMYTVRDASGRFSDARSVAVKAKVKTILNEEGPREIPDGTAFIKFLRSSPSKNFIESLDFGVAD